LKKIKNVVRRARMSDESVRCKTLLASGSVTTEGSGVRGLFGWLAAAVDYSSHSPCKVQFSGDKFCGIAKAFRSHEPPATAARFNERLNALGDPANVGSRGCYPILSLLIDFLPLNRTHSMPLLPCPFCSAMVDVPSSRAGSEIDCPSCHNSVPVPKLGELRKLESEPISLAAKQAFAQSVTGNRAAFALLMGIAAFAIVGASYCLVRFAAIDVPATTEDHIAEIEEVYAQMPAAQLVREWQEMEKFSPQIANPYVYQVIANERSAWLRNALIGLAIAAVAGAIAFLSLSLGRVKT
jgi:hypothetical protein